MDIGLRDRSGIDAKREIKRLRPETAIVALTIQEDEEYFFEMLDGLTERELEVPGHLADGASNSEIGDTLQINPKTVARHRENIMRKLNLHSRTELVKYAIRKGIITP